MFLDSTRSLIVRLRTQRISSRRQTNCTVLNRVRSALQCWIFLGQLLKISSFSFASLAMLDCATHPWHPEQSRGRQFRPLTRCTQKAQAVVRVPVVKQPSPTTVQFSKKGRAPKSDWQRRRLGMLVCTTARLSNHQISARRRRLLLEISSAPPPHKRPSGFAKNGHNGEQ